MNNQFNFLELSKKRTSVRDFSDMPVEKDKLDYIFEAVRLAPSAVNFQPYSFFIIQDKNKLREIYEAYNREWFKTAPACIVACGNHDQSWHRKYDNKDHCDIDVAIAVTHLIMAATELGLGTCWVCNFDKDICIKVLNLHKNQEPVALIPIGYPVNNEIFTSNIKQRKPTGDLLTWL